MDEEDIIPADPLAIDDAAVIVSETDVAHSSADDDEDAEAEGWLAKRYQRRRIDCNPSSLNETSSATADADAHAHAHAHAHARGGTGGGGGGGGTGTGTGTSAREDDSDDDDAEIMKSGRMARKTVSTQANRLQSIIAE